MATGDVTISIAVEGGVTKSVVLDSDTRVKAKAQIGSGPMETDLSVDADWQAYIVNDFARQIVSQADQKATADAAPASKTFTAAS